MSKPPIAAAFALVVRETYQQEVLCVPRTLTSAGFAQRTGLLGLPGGEVEGSEHPLSAIVEALQERAGITWKPAIPRLVEGLKLPRVEKLKHLYGPQGLGYPSCVVRSSGKELLFVLLKPGQWFPAPEGWTPTGGREPPTWRRPHDLAHSYTGAFPTLYRHVLTELLPGWDD